MRFKAAAERNWLQWLGHALASFALQEPPVPVPLSLSPSDRAIDCFPRSRVVDTPPSNPQWSSSRFHPLYSPRKWIGTLMRSRQVNHRRRRKGKPFATPVSVPRVVLCFCRETAWAMPRILPDSAVLRQALFFLRNPASEHIYTNH